MFSNLCCCLACWNLTVCHLTTLVWLVMNTKTNTSCGSPVLDFSNTCLSLPFLCQNRLRTSCTEKRKKEKVPDLFLFSCPARLQSLELMFCCTNIRFFYSLFFAIFFPWFSQDITKIEFHDCVTAIFLLRHVWFNI